METILPSHLTILFPSFTSKEGNFFFAGTPRISYFSTTFVFKIGFTP
ncbi:hypothetical protein EVA_10806 [gut metagenome]|uniref:Uncharacterized protein n=1 Tax=gut metagenome TaxID=749906 RepID=J9CLY2_9ZZZZ